MLIAINLPEVEEKRLEKLEKFVMKNVSHLKSPIEVKFPIDKETGKSKGLYN